MMSIFSFELTDRSTAKAATCMFLDVDLRSRDLLVSSCIFVLMSFLPDSLWSLLQKSQYIIWPLLHFVPSLIAVNRGVSGGVSHNSIQFITVEKLQKPSRSRNCRNLPTVIVCNALTLALHYTEVKKPEYKNLRKTISEVI